ncbi:MAG: DeoR/GlpR family DNA-binding transcription regulator [Ancalomicrobiaceae bacterium]|nr:DeoR/GlpR family DNA-binding transcription regulator [Ancalomicrobiaceae bacterium]
MAEGTLINRIAAETPSLPRALRTVARFILDRPQSFMQLGLSDIATHADVSEPTVIRFCRFFGYAGMAEFRIALAIDLAINGQAQAVATAGFLEPNMTDKAVVNLPQKMAIASAARALADADRSMIVDSGSTAGLFARTLADAAPLVVMTSGLNIVEALRDASQHRVMLPGGTVRYSSSSLIGALVGETISSMRFDTLYLGADAIDPDFGLSTFNEAEAHQNAAMIRLVGRVVVLADSSKFRTPALHRIAGVGDIDIIVTDNGLPGATAERLAAAGVRVICAEPTAIQTARRRQTKDRDPS